MNSHEQYMYPLEEDIVAGAPRGTGVAVACGARGLHRAGMHLLRHLVQQLRVIGELLYYRLE